VGANHRLDVSFLGSFGDPSSILHRPLKHADDRELVATGEDDILMFLIH
jgi:hypothetical protein